MKKRILQRRCWRPFWIAASCAVLLASCHEMPEKEPSAPAVGVAYKVVMPINAAHYKLAPGEVAEMPELEKKTMPAFPPELIALQDRSVQILTQLVINESGGVDRAIFSQSAVTDGLEPFRASIRKAVATWKFSPFVIIRDVSKGNGEFTRMETAKPISLWYQFQFDIKNGQPVITMKGHSST